MESSRFSLKEIFIDSSNLKEESQLWAGILFHLSLCSFEGAFGDSDSDSENGAGKGQLSALLYKNKKIHCVYVCWEMGGHINKNIANFSDCGKHR